MIFGEILSRAHGNFEQKNGVLEFGIIIVNYYCTMNYIIVEKIITGGDRTI
jgi:hypothetical protein